MNFFHPEHSSRKIRGAFAILSLATSIIAMNALQVISLLCFPFSKKLFRSINRMLAGAWWSYCAWCTEKLCGIEIVITGDVLPQAENAIVIANHQQMSDIPVILCLAKQKSRISDLKWYAKDPLKYIPGIGWGMLFIDCIFLKRNWMSDKNSVLATFEKFRKNKIPFWIISFLEGTRSTKKKIAGSQSYALANQLPLLEHVLIPRTKGFIATVQGLENNFDAIYDLTIGFEKFVPTLSEFFLLPIARVHLHTKRYGSEILPREPKDLAGWTLERYKEKDLRMKKFIQDGYF